MSIVVIGSIEDPCTRWKQKVQFKIKDFLYVYMSKDRNIINII